MRWKHVPWPMKALLLLVMATVAFVTLAPFCYLVALSLSSYADTFRVFLWPRGFHWQNYVEAWDTVNLAVYFRNSAYVTLVALAINLTVGTMAAYALARFRLPFKEVIFGVFLAGLILSGETLLIPLFLNLQLVGFLNQWWTLPVVYATIGLPFTIFMLRAFFETLPRELVEAAEIDGCNAVQTFAYVMVPLSRSALVTITLFQFVWFWDEFILAISLVTSRSLHTLPAGLAGLQGEYFTNYPVLAAALTLTIVPVVTVFILTQRQLIRGITSGAVK